MEEFHRTTGDDNEEMREQESGKESCWSPALCLSTVSVDSAKKWKAVFHRELGPSPQTVLLYLPLIVRVFPGILHALLEPLWKLYTDTYTHTV